MDLNRQLSVDQITDAWAAHSPKPLVTSICSARWLTAAVTGARFSHLRPAVFSGFNWGYNNPNEPDSKTVKLHNTETRFHS